MPIQYCICPEHACVVIRGSGSITDADIIAAIEGYLTNPERSPGFDEVWVAFSMNEFAIDFKLVEEYRRILKQYERALGSERVAVVVNRQGVVSDIAKLIATIVSREGGQNHRAFKHFEDAEAWLGHPPGTLKAIMEDGEWEHA